MVHRLMAFLSHPRVKKGGQEREYVTDNDVLMLLQRILKQLLITNAHLAEMMESEIKETDIDDRGDL